MPVGHTPEVYAEALPGKYHAQTVLTAELKPGTNAIDFRLDE